MLHSTLTFNASVSDKQLFGTINTPIQCMPSTQRSLADNTIDAYPVMHNSSILIHMNYTTKVFNNKAIENNSYERYTLRQYVKLANKLGTKDILIHLPESINELYNLQSGIQVIKEEIINQGCTVHLEIPSWSHDLLQAIKNMSGSDDPIEYTNYYFTTILDELTALPVLTYYLVMDTAHLFANGCGGKQIIKIIDRHIDLIKYIHFNGNINVMFKSDIHVQMFSPKNKITDWNLLSTYCSGAGKVCVAENTKQHVTWDEWMRFADEYNFELVPFNAAYTL